MNKPMSLLRQLSAALLLCGLSGAFLSGCGSTNPPKIPEATGPKRPINALTKEQLQTLRDEQDEQQN